MSALMLEQETSPAHLRIEARRVRSRGFCLLLESTGMPNACKRKQTDETTSDEARPAKRIPVPHNGAVETLDLQ